MKDVETNALALLYKLLKNARISFGHAEERRNNPDEIRNLEKKIAALEWLIEIAIKESE